MSFASPLALYGLIPVLALAALYVIRQRRRRRYVLTYSSVSLVQVAASRASTTRRHLPATLYLVALAVLVIGLARPQATFATPRSGGTVILALDASGSMASTDIEPTRIDAARVAIREFVKKQPKGVKIGLVTFAAYGVVLVPPTEDRDQVIGAVQFLSLARSTNIGDGLQVALNAILQAEAGESIGFAAGATPVAKPYVANPDSQVIILLSDGASTTGPSPLQVADHVAQAGIRVYTVGLGASAGARLTPPGNGFPTQRFMELDEVTLKGIAERTDGEYFTAASAKDLNKVYKQLSSKTYIATEPDELTFLATAAGAMLLAIASVLSMRWSSRIP
ncbi:MAG TPA: VWA domain-containing protein [Dehalococcoidia bacterium]|nr:VWA domain-containing protein [Dehalococcoidia bacterium]